MKRWVFLIVLFTWLPKNERRRAEVWQYAGRWHRKRDLVGTFLGSGRLGMEE